MLCRQSDVFAHVRSVVVDEAHQVDGSARGDQLRVLLRRLSAWHAKPRPQHVAMTATVADPEAMGLRLFGREVPAIRAGLERPVQVAWADDVADAARAIRAAGLTKAIFFCNSRRRTEQVGAELGICMKTVEKHRHCEPALAHDQSAAPQSAPARRCWRYGRGFFR